VADLGERLSRCFSAVFPNLRREELLTARPENVEGWDSVAFATLVAVVEEEFALELEPEDMEQLASYAGMLAYLRARQERE